MQVAQHHPMPWQTDSISPRLPTMSTRTDHPLIFSIDDRLAQQHLTQLDLCSKNLKKIEKLPTNIPFNVVLLDYNDITKVEHLDLLTHLIQLSISNNRLIDIRLIGRLRTLQKLDLSNNSLDAIDCLKTLQNLVILNISGNYIQNINALNACHSLQSLDASDNSIRQIEDLSHLTSLKYLNLHKNLIENLTSVPRHWPKSIHTLIISDNEIKDLTEISSISSLNDLNTLYVHDNPCFFVVDDRHGCHQPFDARPYVLNWCLDIQNLDGSAITRKESLKAEWLLSQGKGRSFRVGEHWELVQYLIRVCGTDADERDDLHLSRIMLQQDLYRQNDSEDALMKTSDTLKDANETFSKDVQSKLQQSLLPSESEFVKISPASSVSTGNEPVLSDLHPPPHSKSSFTVSDQQMRTPSPGYLRTANTFHEDPTSEHSSKNRYSAYDNRPIKPLDQNILQSKLNEYTVEHHSSNDDTAAVTYPQSSKRTSAQLAYNANRYSPKTTTRGPTASAAMHVHMRPKSNKTTTTQPTNRAKRHTIAADNANTFHLMNRAVSTVKDKHEQKPISNEIRLHDDDELQLKSAPIHGTLSTLHRENSGELRKLSTSVETMRTSVLQAYLDLHERFTKTTELQTSALAALWKKFETQTTTHQRETDKILAENRLLHQRLRELECLLNPKPSSLHPPLRAHISKRDAKSFFLHWIPNPLNEQRAILGYRIYIDDILKYSVDPGKFESVIDCIRDEGEYRIKLRTYDEKGESDDSNVIITRFRLQQQSITPRSETRTPLHRTQSDQLVEDNTHSDHSSETPWRQTQSQENLVTVPTDEIQPPIIMDKQRDRIEVHRSMSSAGFPLMTPFQTDVSTTPDKKTRTSEELPSPITTSPAQSNHTSSNENIVSRKPPKSPSSSPSRSETTASGSCTKVLFTNESSSTKRSPTRTGIMSRLAKSPHRIKRNNVLLNALPINLSPTTKPDVKAVDRTSTSDEHVDRLPSRSIEMFNSATNPSSSSTTSSSSPLPSQTLLD